MEATSLPTQSLFSLSAEEAVEQAAGLLALRAVALLLDGGRADVDAGEPIRAALDAGEAEAQLLRHLRGEAGAVAVGGVQVAVVRPGGGPDVAVPGGADDRVRGCPGDAGDDRAGRVRGRGRRLAGVGLGTGDGGFRSVAGSRSGASARWVRWWGPAKRRPDAALETQHSRINSRLLVRL